MILLIALLLTTVTSYDQDVIIIGAGYAGLSAAQHLTTLSPSLKVLFLFGKRIRVVRIV